MMDICINIEKKDIEALRLLCDRYYFGLFKGISSDQEDEYMYRDALVKLTNQLEEKLKRFENE